MVSDPATSRSITESFNRYDKTLRSLPDFHAPVCVRAARTAPWYDEDCRREKEETRRHEKRYRYGAFTLRTCRRDEHERVDEYLWYADLQWPELN